jgi:hypothetical protein
MTEAACKGLPLEPTPSLPKKLTATPAAPAAAAAGRPSASPGTQLCLQLKHGKGHHTPRQPDEGQASTVRCTQHTQRKQATAAAGVKAQALLGKQQAGTA